MSKIFCIGLNKTGTRSLHTALVRLGFRSLHAGTIKCPAAANVKVRRAIAEGRPLLHYFNPRIQAFSDLEELSTNFDVADRQYPGSYFILTYRDLDSWLASRTGHVQRNIWRHKLGKYRGNWLTIDVPAWVAEWHSHHQRIHDYFRGQEHRLLKLNICAGAGYNLLCPFLNKACPSETFPWQHRARPTGSEPNPETSGLL